MLLVVANLDAAPSGGLVDRAPHRSGDPVGIHYDLAVQIPGGAPDRLDKRGLRPEKSLLVGVEDGDQRYLGYVKALSEQVYPHQNVEDPESEVLDDLGALDGLDAEVDVSDLDPVLCQKVGKILRHLSREGGDEDSLPRPGALLYLAEEVIDLPLDRSDLGLGIDKAGRPDELLGQRIAVLPFIVAGSRADEDRLVDLLLELLEEKGTVVEGRRKPEAVIDKILLPRVVAAAHSPYLRQSDVAFVDEEQPVLREIIQQAERRRPRRPARHNP